MNMKPDQDPAVDSDSESLLNPIQFQNLVNKNNGGEFTSTHSEFEL